MKKKILMLFTVCVIMVTVSACGNKEEQDSTTVQLDTVLEESSFESEETSKETPEHTETESIPEIETEIETESIPKTEVEIETESIPETESVPENEPEAETTPLYGEELESSELIEDMNAIFQSALDYMVPEEQLDAASKVSNAILKNTDITINLAKDDICNITVKYPNAAKALKEAEAKLAADASQEEIDLMLQNLTNAIQNGEVDIIEKTMDVSIIEVEEFKTIQWTTELYDAVTGGLYSIE